MRVIPAIDLRGGMVVRLTQGRADQSTAFDDDPIGRARAFAAAGATRIHVVDLDGAFEGGARQAELVGRIAAAVAPVEVQVGGGVRDVFSAMAYFAQGVAAVILGTAAAENPKLFADCCRLYPRRVLAGIDARDGRVAVRGWTETTQLDAVDLARRLAAAGAAAIIHTDIARDGTGAGPNVAATLALAQAVSIPVFASGGVATLDDVRALAAAPPIAGVIVGRAIYEGTLDLAAALALGATERP
jgi:phosphoribosylformimino-5-aminoimidazole carboxamide ribotide isomerase